MTTSDRVLGVLGLFTLEEPEWTVEDAAARLGLAVSTAYRYFRSLSKAGLIVALATGRYALGPAIIQYDRQIRLQDPLTTAAQPIMKRLTGQLPPHTVTLLCRLFRSQVMCVHQESAGRPDFAISYERGRPMPLFRGAASKSILANMPLRAVKAVFQEHQTRFAQANLGRTWDEVKERLRELRSAGVSVTRGELDPGMCGIGVPVFETNGVVVGSLSVVIPAQHLEAQLLSDITQLLRSASEEVSWALSLRAGGTGSPVSPPSAKGKVPSAPPELGRAKRRAVPRELKPARRRARA
jgi:DNA-binding IclR family transcriptional regulator